jgi:pSer/pThr/pTyr-binding forkhead associated (FHA) protein
MLAQLISVKGDRAIRITKDITVVGRRPEVCDLVIPSDSISKIHSVISKTDGLLFVRDLGSTNGTRVNGQRVTRGALLPGDELAFASIKFKVHLGPAPASVEEEIGHEDRTEVIAPLPEANTSNPEFDAADISVSDDDE